MNKEVEQSYISVHSRPDVTYVPPHIHDGFELVYIFDGTGIVSIYDKEVNVGKGDLLFYDVKTLHCLNKKETLRSININIDPQIFDDQGETTNQLSDILALSWFREFSIDDINQRVFVHMHREEQSRVGFIIQEMLHEYSKKDIGYERILYGYLNVVFSMLFRQLKKDTGISVRQDMSIISDKVIAYIKANYNQKITLSDLAKESFYQPNYFSKVFKECYGLSPMKYINKIRIDRSMNELRTTNESISVIMENVGIHDRKHFYSIFKDQVGCTPGEYRSKYPTN